MDVGKTVSTFSINSVDKANLDQNLGKSYQDQPAVVEAGSCVSRSGKGVHAGT